MVDFSGVADLSPVMLAARNGRRAAVEAGDAVAVAQRDAFGSALTAERIARFQGRVSA